MARPDFRGTAARRLAEERELSPAILSLISPEGTERPLGVRNIPLERITPNPDQPRMNFDEQALADLAASVREHGVLQPIAEAGHQGEQQDGKPDGSAIHGGNTGLRRGRAPSAPARYPARA